MPVETHLTTSPRRRAVAIGLVAGFVVTFFATLVLVRMHTLRPDGRGAIVTPLWQFYLDETAWLFRPRPMGPSSGSSALSVAVQHVLVSLLGGGLSAAAVVLVQCLRRRRGETGKLQQA